MSDCSTNAMKPKDPFPNGLWPDKGDCHTCEKYGNCAYEQFGLRWRGATCEYRPSSYHVLNQRYEQLEQVAREMLYDFESARRLSFDGHTSKALDLISLASDGYKKQLEALGMKIDG